MAPPPTLTIRVAATPAGIRKAGEALESFNAEHGLADSVAWPLRLALDEILSNVVRYAGTAQALQIDVTVTLARGAVELTVADDGPAFDPLQAAAPDLGAQIEHRQPGGLGIHLVRQLMDHVEYVRANGWNRLVMKWHVPQQAPAGP